MARLETITKPALTTRRLAETNGTELRRRELGAFLRSRRERIKPEQVGLHSMRRRRTPGLRREEVAQLAGVGITWYTWLEQGRDIHPSAQVLDAIARTLQLDSHEHSHLFTLAGMATTTIADQCLGLCSTVQPLIDQLDPFPAVVVNSRLDLLACNRVYASFFPDLETIPIEDRNLLWLAFTHSEWQAAIVDWDDIVGRMVAEYRAAMAEHLDEAAWKTLVSRLHRASPEFTALWERHDVQGVESRTKRARHPDVGLLQLIYTNLWVGQQVGIRIIAFTPADERTRRRLERLSESLDQQTAEPALGAA
jgi:MmyB-like transcription regulator ligand binding domain/Helix-turn-helix domain